MWRGGPYAAVILLVMARAAALKVLDVGAPRTGTQTLQTALEILGLNTLHTGLNATFRMPFCAWMLGGKAWKAPVHVLDHFDAAMDEPMQLIYPEVMEAFPEAKFIYTVREPEDWFASYDSIMADLRRQSAIKKRIQNTKRLRSHSQPSQPLAPLVETIKEAASNVWDNMFDSCQGCQYWGCKFGTPESVDVKPQCLKSYKDHFNQVKTTIPAERLLIYNLTDGWGPLCEFLNKPIPNQDFPHEDWVRSETTSSLRRAGLQPTPKRMTGSAVPSVGVGLVQRTAKALKAEL